MVCDTKGIARARDIAECINTLSAFLALRDIPSLTGEGLMARIGAPRADVMILFGGSILEGVEVLSRAMQNAVARRYIICGGVGHTTGTLLSEIGHHLGVDTSHMCEAQALQTYLMARHSQKADYLETRSTNCGNNIDFSLAMLKEKMPQAESLILVQDSTMQRRMDAGFRLRAANLKLVNFAAYSVKVVPCGASLCYDNAPLGMWDIDRYISLLLGEIPRLLDTEQGYGPRGKGYIAHMDIPGSVLAAYERLLAEYPSHIRRADA